jgi:hypothetical protein
MGLIVDLSMAHTYIPGFKCVLRVVLLLIALTDWYEVLGYTNPLSNAKYVYSILVVGPVLVLDRVMRVESIFDSSALMISIYFGYVVSHVRLSLGTVVFGSPVGGHLIFTNVVQLMYISFSVMHIFDIKRCGISERVGAFIILVVFIATVQSTPNVEEAHELTVAGFAALYSTICIIWVYAMGVNMMINLLNKTTRVPMGVVVSDKNGKRGTGFVIVQSFTPCFIRFGCIMYTTGWCQVVAVVCCTVTLTVVLMWRAVDTSPAIHQEYSINDGAVHDAVPHVVIHQDAAAGASMCVSAISFSPNSSERNPFIPSVKRVDTSAGSAALHMSTMKQEVDNDHDLMEVDDDNDVEMFRRAMQASSVAM